MKTTPCFRAALAALALPATLVAQQIAVPVPTPSAVRDGGIFHLATNTWTRNAPSASLGADVLYDNTCPSGFFHSLDGDTVIDEGGLPSQFTPDSTTTKPGCATSYAIDGFRIAYCSENASAAFDVAFYDSYTQCTTVIGVTPTASFALTNLPGTNGGVQFCWSVAIDVSATPFTLSAVQQTQIAPLFGLAISSPQTTRLQGPLIAGNSANCATWDGTSWDPTVDLAESGTGMYARDQFRSEGGPTIPGCYWFGGDPFAGFALELYGDTCAPDGWGQEGFCYPAVDSTLPCPCAMQPVPGSNTGCVHSLGYGARLEGTGIARLSSDSVVLAGTQMPPNSSVLYFQGTLRHNAGVGRVFGDGLRCAGGSVVRLAIAANSGAGASQYPSGADPSVSTRGAVTATGSRTYQAWYRNVAPYCTPAGFNTTNGWEIYWGV